jgi:hypothetical protein
MWRTFLESTVLYTSLQYSECSFVASSQRKYDDVECSISASVSCMGSGMWRTFREFVLYLLYTTVNAVLLLFRKEFLCHGWKADFLWDI